MAFIYCIENLTNNKRYIGETTYPIEKRWKEHIRMSKRQFIHRPLYSAINKYGVESFVIYLVEECLDECRWEREQYWIKHFDTFNNGYNATLGGDGGSLKDISKEEFIFLYENHFSPQEVAEYFNCCVDTVSEYAKKFNITFKGWNQRHDIICIGDNFTKSFYSAGDAARWLVQEGFSTAKTDSISINIMRCCKGDRKSAYKLKWMFLSDFKQH